MRGLPTTQRGLYPCKSLKTRMTCAANRKGNNVKTVKALACLSFAVLFVSLVALGTSLPTEAKANLESTQQRPQLALADGLVDYWRMDEASGDFIGAANGKTFTAYGTVTNAVGKVYATARQFPGVGTPGAGIRDNNDVRFGDTDVTFTFWWYQYTQPLGAGNNLYHYIWHQDDYYGGYTIGVNRGDQVFMQSGSGNNQFDTLHSSAVSSPTNTWHLVIAWYDSTAHELHLRVDNGEDQFTSALTHTRRCSGLGTVVRSSKPTPL